jgi:alcohol dehydrogenase YqhD (iron-dependent ADH family)
MKSFKGRRRQRYLDFATHVMGISKGDHTDDQLIDLGIQAFEAFLENIGVPTRLESVNIHRQDLDAIIDGVVKVSFGPDGTLNCNPKVTKEDLSNMLNTAL